MHPRVHASTAPGKAAVIMADTGAVTTYGDLDADSNRFAHFLRGHGLFAGDRVAFLLGNSAMLFALTWGAQRSGLIFVMIPSRASADEIAYMVADSGARMLVADADLATIAVQAGLDVPIFTVNAAETHSAETGPLPGASPLEAAMADLPATPIADERAGTDMLYSSGTTGKPKGVSLVIPEDPAIDVPNKLTAIMSLVFGFGADTVYLSPAPLYHAAPLRFSMNIHRLGGTVVVMPRFDPEGALAAIARYGVTGGQFVPTHFVRMLKLPDAVRAHYDLSTLKMAIHAAAPCPIPVKQAMIAWWGPIIWEYYAGSESMGMTVISPQEWLTHPGSVGRPAGEGAIHICDEAGEPLPPKVEGVIHFEGDFQFSYHNDPEKTRSVFNRHGWATLGDVGWKDEEGYLYLTDRKSFMIISGGVNIYPQEIENHLVTHPKVADAAVIGAPHDEMGEEVVAVIQPMNPDDAGPELGQELVAWCRAHLSGVKQPRRIDFVAELPRQENGKLYKRLLRDAYRDRYEAERSVENGS